MRHEISRLGKHGPCRAFRRTRIRGELADKIVEQRRRIMKHTPWFLLAAVAVFAIPLAAHHSFGAEYDGNKPIKLAGTVTKIDWTNPHAYIYLHVKDEKGAVASWKFEGDGPARLFR